MIFLLFLNCSFQAVTNWKPIEGGGGITSEVSPIEIIIIELFEP